MLDFTNTVDWRGTERQHDWLAGPADFLAWGRRAGILDDGQVRDLWAYAEEHSEQVSRTHGIALRLREALFGLLKAIVENREPRPADLELFNRQLCRAFACSALYRRSEPRSAYRLGSSSLENALEALLYDLVRRAADLLTTIDPRRLKICAYQDCGWLFLDKTKNSSRRWCDMANCGNRAKAKSFYRRKRQTAAG